MNGLLTYFGWTAGHKACPATVCCQSYVQMRHLGFASALCNFLLQYNHVLMETQAAFCNSVSVTGPEMMARLARSGQSALVIHDLLVVTGGILRDISIYVDIVIMNLNTLAFIK